jgi:hypothetical protein
MTTSTLHPKSIGNALTAALVGTIAAGAIAAGAITLTAPPAHADKISETTIKSECKDAGGTYVTKVVEGTRFSSCAYKDNDGNQSTDFYVRGVYTSTKEGGK